MGVGVGVSGMCVGVFCMWVGVGVRACVHDCSYSVHACVR